MTQKRMTKREALHENWFLFAMVIAVVIAIAAAIYFYLTGQIGHDIPAS